MYALNRMVHASVSKMLANLAMCEAIRIMHGSSACEGHHYARVHFIPKKQLCFGLVYACVHEMVCMRVRMKVFAYVCVLGVSLYASRLYDIVCMRVCIKVCACVCVVCFWVCVRGVASIN